MTPKPPSIQGPFITVVLHGNLDPLNQRSVRNTHFKIIENYWEILNSLFNQLPFITSDVLIVGGLSGESK